MNADSSAQPDLGAIEARLAAANAEVDALCHHEHGWRMCIPVHQTDSDLVITNALNDIAALLARCRALERERDEALRLFGVHDDDVGQPY